jgi:hypothetical protein
VLIYEALGFSLLILWCWLDELYDLPARLFGGTPSHANIVEAIEETIVIGIFGLAVVSTSFRSLSRIKLLEGIVPTCAFCKKIRVGEDWQKMEEYFSKRSEAKFSHGYCPPCMEKHYGISEKDAG